MQRDPSLDCNRGLTECHKVNGLNIFVIVTLQQWSVKYLFGCKNIPNYEACFPAVVNIFLARFRTSTGGMNGMIR